MSNRAPGFEKHPNHIVEIDALQGTMTVESNDLQIASSNRIKAVTESKHSLALYIPLEDIDQSLLTPSETQTYCPFKGYASYWHVQTDHGQIEDAFWSYRTPYDECLEIKDYASFYTEKVLVSVT